MKILIIDDNAEMRSLVRSLLSDVADEIHDYGDGFDALAHYESCLPDWSVVDVFMPELDGLAVTAWIKTHYPQARVAIMTQDDNPHLRDLALKIGATAFVPKDDLLQLRGLISATPNPGREETEPFSPGFPDSAQPVDLKVRNQQPDPAENEFPSI